MRFSGKSVLITGGASGLGAACVRAFSSEGARVSFCGREDDLGRALAKELSLKGRAVIFSHADVRVEEDMATFTGGAGGIDIAVNCAGRNNPPNRLADIPPKEFRDVLETNLFGVLNAMRAEILAMPKGGVIINVASILSEVPSGWMAAYSTSKAAVVSLTQAAAEDYRDQGFRIYAFSPGPMATPMFDQALKDIAGDTGKYAGGFPEKGRAMDPAKAAKAILDLADLETAPPTGTNFLLPK